MTTGTSKAVTGSRETDTLEHKMFLSKRLNVRQHLQGLLAKRARLTQEILILKRSDKEKSQNYRNNLNKSLHKIKESSILSEDEMNQEIELTEALIQLDSDTKMFQDLLTSYAELEPEIRLIDLKEQTPQKKEFHSKLTPTQLALARNSIFFNEE